MFTSQPIAITSALPDKCNAAGSGEFPEPGDFDFQCTDPYGQGTVYEHCWCTDEGDLVRREEGGGRNTTQPTTSSN